MNEIFEIGESCKEIGIITRTSTQGEELELVREFIEYRKELFKPTTTKNLAIFVEPKVSMAYPDIVFVEYNPNNYEHWNDTRFKLNSSDLKILYHIYASRRIDTGNIVIQLGAGWKNTVLSIEKLYDSNLIIRKNHMWCIKSKKNLCVKRIEAVEAKISKWNDVFQQAIINTNFASESYALSKIAITPKQNVIERFDSFGIGLYIHSRTGFKIAREANKVRIPVSFNSIYFNEWIGRARALAERAG